MNIILQNTKCGDKMQKVDKEGNVTKEYIDYVEKLNRDDLERFFMGADFLNDDLNQEIERLNNIINEINNAFEDKNIHNNMELVRKIKNILKGVDK